MTDGALQVAAYWAYKYEPTPAAFDTPFLPFALFSQTFSFCLLSLARFFKLFELRFKDVFAPCLGKND
jgi:hypothetical protein